MNRGEKFFADQEYETVSDANVLTVIASESYDSFALSYTHCKQIIALLNMQLSYMIWIRGGNYYEYWKSNIDNSKRTAINPRAIWGVISCDTANSFKLGK